MTTFSQSLDISINFPMKQYLIIYDFLFRIKESNKIWHIEEDIIKKFMRFGMMIQK